jgi:hypothetical protein
MVKPNFFFVGAPKCGTTSIAHHLAQHPNIFISNPKEPKYFDSEIACGITSLKAYESLFTKVNSRHQIVGEASTSYLYSRTAIKKIMSYSPNAKILVSIRNPYEMVQSLHGQAIRGNYENQHDFSIAWKLQTDRRSGFNIPESCHSARMVLYGDRCALGDQIENLYNTVDTDKICLVFFDDLKNNPSKLYDEIYSFLQLPSDCSKNFPVLNKNVHIRWPYIINLTRFLGKKKRLLGIYKSLGIANWIKAYISTNEAPKQIIQNELWKEMDEIFMPQILKIESISGRDLKNWYYYRN